MMVTFEEMSEASFLTFSSTKSVTRKQLSLCSAVAEPESYPDKRPLVRMCVQNFQFSQIDTF